MNILYHPLHCGYDIELSKIGHQFYLLSGEWKGLARYKTHPLPANFHVDWDRKSTPIDVAIIGDHGIEKFTGFDVPLIFNFLGDWGAPGSNFKSEWEDPASVAVFLSKDTADRWHMKDPFKKRIIEYGIDLETYKDYMGLKGVVAIGHDIPHRGEKGKENLVEIAKRIKIDLIGYGNEKYDFSIGPIPDHAAFVDKLRRYKVYVNPSWIASMGMVEAMGMGMPVVTFKTFNYPDLLIDGYSCFVVESVSQAVDRIQELLADGELCHKMGQTARAMVMARFPVRKFRESWNLLIQEVTFLAKRRKEEEAERARRQKEEETKRRKEEEEWIRQRSELEAEKIRNRMELEAREEKRKAEAEDQKKREEAIQKEVRERIEKRAKELQSASGLENKVIGLIMDPLVGRATVSEDPAREKARRILEFYRLSDKSASLNEANINRSRELVSSLRLEDKIAGVLMDPAAGPGLLEEDARAKVARLLQYVRPR